MPVRVLGIDPGSRATGWGVVEASGSRLLRVGGGVIRPREGPLGARLAEIHSGLLGVIEAFRPGEVAVEAVFSARSARSALVLGQARGAALCACGLAGLALSEYAPAAVKSAVAGDGRAEKLQVQRMVGRLLGLAAPPPSDEADALAVAICHGQGAALRRAVARQGAALRGVVASRHRARA